MRSEAGEPLRVFWVRTLPIFDCKPDSNGSQGVSFNQTNQGGRIMSSQPVARMKNDTQVGNILNWGLKLLEHLFPQ